MEFLELLTTRRSIRSFKQEPVPIDIIMAIINDSCLAPSHSNNQPWRYIIIQNKDYIKILSDESRKNLLVEIRNDLSTCNKGYIPLLERDSYNVFHNAPCLVLIVGLSKVPSLMVDCTLAASYFMLSAASRDLGTCWVGMGRHIRSAKILDMIGLPENHTIVAPIVIGYPNKMPPIRKRKNPEILKIIS